MAQIAQKSARRADRIGIFVLLLAVVSAEAAFGSDRSPDVTPTPLPKVEVQTVGTGPRFLTATEERKLVAPSSATSSTAQPSRRSTAGSLVAPWTPPFAKDAGFTTFVPLPGFAERTLVVKPFVESPSGPIGRKAGPAQ